MRGTDFCPRHLQGQDVAASLCSPLNSRGGSGHELDLSPGSITRWFHCSTAPLCLAEPRMETALPTIQTHPGAHEGV